MWRARTKDTRTLALAVKAPCPNHLDYRGLPSPETSKKAKVRLLRKSSLPPFKHAAASCVGDVIALSYVCEEAVIPFQLPLSIHIDTTKQRFRIVRPDAISRCVRSCGTSMLVRRASAGVRHCDSEMRNSLLLGMFILRVSLLIG